MTPTDTSWIVEGAQVAIYDLGGYDGARVSVTTVERLTTTQIVLAGNHGRFRRDTLRPVGDHHGAELLPVTDQRVRDVRARRRLRNLGRDVADLIGQVPRSADIGAVLGVLGEVEQMVERTRAAVEDLEAQR